MSELTDHQIEILKIAHDTQREEWTYRRDERYRLFSWSSSLFLAITGVLAASDLKLEPIHKWVFGVAVTVLGAFILIRQGRINFQAMYTLQVLAEIDERLGFFTRDDGNDSIYPQSWKPSVQRVTWRTKTGLIFQNIVTSFLLALALAMICICEQP
jgi:hypothetical protein